jgi:hypothetical protein
MFVHLKLGCNLAKVSKEQMKCMRKNIGPLLTLAFMVMFLICGVCGCHPMLWSDGIYPRPRPKTAKMIALEQKIDEWQKLGARVDPLLGEYYFANKSKCKFPYNDNEAEIEGFADYAAQHGILLKKGQIVDSWGDPVHFIIAHEGDQMLRARSQSYGIYGMPSNEIILGLLLDKPSRLADPSNKKWVLQNVRIPVNQQPNASK